MSASAAIRSWRPDLIRPGQTSGNHDNLLNLTHTTTCLHIANVLALSEALALENLGVRNHPLFDMNAFFKTFSKLGPNSNDIRI